MAGEVDAARSADPASAAEQEQQGDARHGVRDRERQVDQGLDCATAGKPMARENVGQRDAEQRRDACRDRGVLEAEQGGIPDLRGRGRQRGVPQAAGREG
jgi:hypothetical protein